METVRVLYRRLALKREKKAALAELAGKERAWDLTKAQLQGLAQGRGCSKKRDLYK